MHSITHHGIFYRNHNYLDQGSTLVNRAAGQVCKSYQSMAVQFGSRTLLICRETARIFQCSVWCLEVLKSSEKKSESYEVVAFLC